MLQVNGYAACAETPLDALTTYLTPNDLFFVRQHWIPQAPHLKSWALAVDGGVEAPPHLSLPALTPPPLPPFTSPPQCTLPSPSSPTRPLLPSGPPHRPAGGRRSSGAARARRRWRTPGSHARWTAGRSPCSMELRRGWGCRAGPVTIG